MKIEWLGHSCFKLTESTGASVVTDPYPSSLGFKLSNVSADIVTVSHKHQYHSSTEAINDAKVVLDRTGSYEIDGIHIYSVMSYHDTKKGSIRGKNLVFKFRMDGVDVCHLGDIGEPISPMIAELVTPVNVLLIPIGGGTTIDAETAKEYIDMLMPDVVIPMHYQEHGSRLDLDNINNFLDLFEEEDIKYLNENFIEFDRTDFDGERTQIIIPKRK